MAWLDGLSTVAVGGSAVAIQAPAHPPTSPSTTARRRRPVVASLAPSTLIVVDGMTFDLQILVDTVSHTKRLLQSGRVRPSVGSAAPCAAERARSRPPERFGMCFAVLNTVMSTGPSR
jgi:hypothetical protein